MSTFWFALHFSTFYPTKSAPVLCSLLACPCVLPAEGKCHLGQTEAFRPQNLQNFLHFFPRIHSDICSYWHLGFRQLLRCVVPAWAWFGLLHRRTGSGGRRTPWGRPPAPRPLAPSDLRYLRTQVRRSMSVVWKTNIVWIISPCFSVKLWASWRLRERERARAPRQRWIIGCISLGSCCYFRERWLMFFSSHSFSFHQRGRSAAFMYSQRIKTGLWIRMRVAQRERERDKQQGGDL